MWKITVEGIEVPVCNSCVLGEHMTYGYKHIDFDTEERGGCKNLSLDRQSQCNCHKEWSELQVEIEKKRKELIENPEGLTKYDLEILYKSTGSKNVLKELRSRT